MEKNRIPLWLTLFRLIVSPLVFPFLIFFFLPSNIFSFNVILAIVFLLIGLTDFFDGYFARLFKQETALGKMLDHVADKVFISSVLIVLVAVHKIWFFWAILLIGRDIFIGGLRQVACEHKVVIHVSWLGKLKTAFQIVTITWIIVNPAQALGFYGAPGWNYGELSLILISIIVSYWSAQGYYKIFRDELGV